MATKPDIAALEQHLHDTERDVLVLAHAQAVQRLRNDPTKANFEAVRAAQAAVQALDAQAAPPPAAPVETIPNRHQAAQYLIDDGWRLTPKTFYQHVRKGLVTPRADGSFTIPDLDTYAVAHLARLDGTHERTLLEELRESKLEAEARLKRAQADRQELLNAIAEGKYLEADRVAAGLAARAHRLRQDGHRWIKSDAAHLVRVAGGEDDRIPDVIAHLLRAFDTWLAAYAAPSAWEDA